MSMQKLAWPETSFQIQITETLVFQGTRRPPNRFHRFMMRLLLGWRFTVFKGANK